MKLWIIGKRGMLSQALQRVCEEQGIHFLVTSRKEVDVTDPTALKHQFETLHLTHVVNCSGYTAVDRAEEEKEKAEKLNVHAVETLGRLAKENNVKLIHFSTDYVFDGNESTPYSEDSAAAPLSIYGQTKRLGEEKLQGVNPQACIIRSSWVFGLEGNNFVQTMTHLMKQHESLRVVSDQKGRPTYCEDLARAALDLLNHEGIYHFANEGETTWLEFAEEILKLLKQTGAEVKCKKIDPISSQEYAAPAIRPAFSVLKTDKYEKAAEKSPRHWQECLREYFERVEC